MKRALGLKDFITVDVDHRVKAYGAVLKFGDGSSVVFVLLVLCWSGRR